MKARSGGGASAGSGVSLALRIRKTRADGLLAAVGRERRDGGVGRPDRRAPEGVEEGIVRPAARAHRCAF